MAVQVAKVKWTRLVCLGLIRTLWDLCFWVLAAWMPRQFRGVPAGALLTVVPRATFPRILRVRPSEQNLVTEVRTLRTSTFEGALLTPLAIDIRSTPVLCSVVRTTVLLSWPWVRWLIPPTT